MRYRQVISMSEQLFGAVSCEDYERRKKNDSTGLFNLLTPPITKPPVPDWVQMV